ncbi:hypothetical protein [Pseudomaricurvus sp. HS19]|uniref:hypothetical protein n=1 Tax=Pseudomaricurvus sp. HS19 TaxID=2692626 RepID=UPI00136F5B6B|nr:hypothetical protein [Pseudomaricurvus sp. HS19]MYM63881.1 hypothetical protein [Pseudomaricurvus sp. HS19]
MSLDCFWLTGVIVFRYHKYCVIEISGHLQRQAGDQWYLLDGCAAAVDAAGSGNQAVAIADSGLLAFLRNRVLPEVSDNNALIAARITGSVGMDDGVVQLAGVTQAQLQLAGQHFGYSTIAATHDSRPGNPDSGR